MNTAVALAGAGVGREAFGEIHLDAKTPGHFGVGLHQRVVELVRADEDDLDLGIHCFGPHGDDGHGHERAAGLFDLGLPGAQETPHPGPGGFVCREVGQLHDQVAAVGLEQAAGAHAHEVGHEHVFFGLVFDAAKQGVCAGVVFDDHRCAGEACVVDHHVDAVARQQLRQCGLAHFVFAVRCDEELQVFQHVVLHLVEVRAELDRVLDLLLQAGADGLQLVVQQGLDRLAPQGTPALRS